MKLAFIKSHGEILIFQKTLAELINSLDPSLTMPQSSSINILSSKYFQVPLHFNIFQAFLLMIKHPEEI